MLTTTVLACDCPKIVVPAMNTRMYDNPVTQDNLEKLRKYGMTVVEPAAGRLACGDVGKGKMPEPDVLFQYVLMACAFPKDMEGKKVLVTAGPTQERIDPVRYITNHSTGRMGYSIAKICALRGAKVTLVTGQTALEPPLFVDVVPVVSARDMYEAAPTTARQLQATRRSRSPTATWPSPWRGPTISWGISGSTRDRDSSSADFPWRPRTCWRTPGPSWRGKTWT